MHPVSRGQSDLAEMIDLEPLGLAVGCAGWMPRYAVRVAKEGDSRMSETDYDKYYHLEKYLFSEVSARLKADRRLAAFDFFCIIIWKSNRSKAKIARLILRDGKYSNYQLAVDALVRNILHKRDPQARMRVLLEEWQFRLPMASAILTVLYPKKFTVYDVRVCEVLNMPEKDKYATAFDSLWRRYCNYLRRVREANLPSNDLRSRDRYLWGKSFAQDLRKDMRKGFPEKQE
jgi:hypothetical protein